MTGKKLKELVLELEGFWHDGYEITSTCLAHRDEDEKGIYYGFTIKKDREE